MELFEPCYFKGFSLIGTFYILLIAFFDDNLVGPFGEGWLTTLILVLCLRALFSCCSSLFYWSSLISVSFLSLLKWSLRSAWYC